MYFPNLRSNLTFIFRKAVGGLFPKSKSVSTYVLRNFKHLFWCRTFVIDPTVACFALACLLEI
eukprot:snap_masked-scaffold_76-processed-gene-0.50-mRNA-1 protein AED:1.00 eAED:1.00 QI:0/0/0/0/1/1/2/0/62